MSMVVMRRKARAKQLLSQKNASSGTFSLNYTNTGKHLMGRTSSRAKILPPLLRAFKNRRVDCCGGPSETVIKNVCVGSSKGIKKVPIRQISNRNRLRRLALKCSDGKCRDLSSNPLWQLSPEQHASARTERLAAAAIQAADISCNYFDNTINKKTRVGVNRSQNSLIRGRVGDCPTTKDIKKNKSASWNIAKNKSESLYCDKNRLPFNNKRCTPAA